MKQLNKKIIRDKLLMAQTINKSSISLDYIIRQQHSFSQCSYVYMSYMHEIAGMIM